MYCTARVARVDKLAKTSLRTSELRSAQLEDVAGWDLAMLDCLLPQGCESVQADADITAAADATSVVLQRALKGAWLSPKVNLLVQYCARILRSEHIFGIH